MGDMTEADGITMDRVREVMAQVRSHEPQLTRVRMRPDVWEHVKAVMPSEPLPIADRPMHEALTPFGGVPVVLDDTLVVRWRLEYDGPYDLAATKADHVGHRTHLIYHCPRCDWQRDEGWVAGGVPGPARQARNEAVRSHMEHEHPWWVRWLRFKSWAQTP